MTPPALDIAMAAVALDEEDKASAVNSYFEEVLGPLFKFSNYPFWQAASTESGKSQLQAAISAVRAGVSRRERLRNIEMMTLAGEAGLPVKAHFDWFIAQSGGHLVATGDPCSDDIVERRAKDSELIDFFQNAPIALHWLSGTGHVMWANQTELDTLGYTAEEYIGQPIMKFCPDEEELVLEIFKTLGSGNTIKDVPVRFRTKQGKIVPLLIDSNVAYKVDESGEKTFNHTRCFIRDDTGRRVRQARYEAQLKEAERTQKLFDAYVSRTLHLLKTPCHVLLQALSLAVTKTDDVSGSLSGDLAAEVDEAAALMRRSMVSLTEMIRMINDAGDAMRFEQGAFLKTVAVPVSLSDMGRLAATLILPLVRPGVVVTFERSAGPSRCKVDQSVLQRALDQLLRNAAAAAPNDGAITLFVSYESGFSGSRVRFEVHDNGIGLGSDQSNLFRLGFRAGSADYVGENVGPAAFSRQAESSGARVEEQRKQLEDRLALTSTARNEGMGVGLCLAYGLVRALGGELRAYSKPGDTRFYFSIPAVDLTDETGPENFVAQPEPAIQSVETATKHCKSITIDSSPTSTPKALLDTAGTWTGTQSPSMVSTASTAPHTKFSSADIAARGLKALETPHVLVVEDTPTASAILCLLLKKLGCTTQVAENGQEAVNVARDAPSGLFDLVIMDLRMPVMDGFEATKILKTEKLLDAPIVALTAETGTEVRKQCDELGFDGFYSKPMTFPQLTRLMKESVGYTQAPAS